MSFTPKILVTADLHLTDRGEDEYRWTIFDWIERRLSQKDDGYTHWAILGDLTEVKDRHSASLIHRLDERVRRLAAICPGVILKGNHDYVDPSEPFFSFLGNVPDVTFVAVPTRLQIGNLSVAAIPHLQGWDSRTKRACRAVGRVPGSEARFVWCHQCFRGAKNEAGHGLDGIMAYKLMHCFPHAEGMLAGDIHTFQTIHNREEWQYVGAPHPVDFGDNYQPRCVRMEGTMIVPMPRTTMKKASLRAPCTTKPAVLLKDLSKGDRAKVTLSLSRAEMYRWDELRVAYNKYAQAHDIDLVSVQMHVTKNHRKDKALERARSMHKPKHVLSSYAKVRKDISRTSLMFGFKMLRSAMERKEKGSK